MVKKKTRGEIIPIPKIYTNEVVLNRNKMPIGIRKGQIPGSVMFRPTQLMSIKNYIENKKIRKNYRNYTKINNNKKVIKGYNSIKKLDAEKLCNPQNFLYREFRIPNGSSLNFFNFVKNNNNSSLKINRTVSRGVLPLGEGLEAKILLGCIDDKCKTKVAIKVSKPEKAKDAIREYKITKEIYDKCVKKSPHIVQPITQVKCGNPMYTYYEFFNGGSLDNWLRRHKSITNAQLKSIIFQILYTLKVIYETIPKFRHNDLHSGNVFVKTGKGIPSTGSTKYGKYRVKNMGIFTGIADFGFSMVPSNPNPSIVRGEYSHFGVTKNSTVGQNTFTFLASIAKDSGKRELLKFLEDVTGINVKNKFKGNVFNIRLIKNNGKVKAIDEMLDNKFFDEIRVNAPKRVQPVPKAPPAPRASTPMQGKCGTRAVKGKPGAEGMTTADLRNLIKAHTEFKIPAGAKRADLCKLLSKFTVGRKALGISNGPKVFKPTRPAPVKTTYRKAPSPIRFEKKNKNNITRRVRATQKQPANNIKLPRGQGVKRVIRLLAERIYERNPNNNRNYQTRMDNAGRMARKLYTNKYRDLVKAGLIEEGELITANNFGLVRKSPVRTSPPVVRKSPVRAARPARPVARKSPVRAARPARPVARKSPARPEISRNSKGRVRVNRKICDSYKRTEINEILMGFGMNPKEFKSKGSACTAISVAAENMGKLMRYRTKAEEAASLKKFRQNLLKK